MTKNNTVLKQTKWIYSLVKEKLWLEQMALEGWFLTDLTWGVRYTFEKRAPRRLIYEVDRFNLTKKTTLKEIKHKEDFFAMSAEMGWKVIIHDEDQNYYFCKEYKEGEINELYNDSDSKQLRAEKYYNRYKDLEAEMIKVSFVTAILGFLLAIMSNIISSSITGFTIFFFGCLIFCLGFTLIYKKIAENYYKDLLMTTEEWKELHRNYSKNNKTLRKLFFTNKKCNAFLSQQSKKGWHIVNMSALKYIFVSGEPVKYIYTMDSKHLTNQRIKVAGGTKLKDSKDWLGMNNDWQVQSLKDAESKKWAFVCALENKSILYRNRENVTPEALNEKKYEKRFRFNSLIGKLSFWFLLGVLVGLISAIIQ